jgi:hypothetical protein
MGMRRCNKINYSGFILLIVLIFLQILSILALYSGQAAMWQSKTTNQISAKKKLAISAHIQLRLTEKQLINNIPLCRIPMDYPTVTMNQPVSWWSRVACSGDSHHFRYYYVVEYMGEDACADVESLSASYYRISLLMVNSNNLLQKIKLQSTVIKPVTAVDSCNDKHHEVKLGRQGVRELV